MALSTDNIIAVSNLNSEFMVAALKSVEPVIPTAYKRDAQTFENRTFQSGETVNIVRADQPMMPTQSNVIQIDPIINQTFSATVLQYNDGMQIAGIAQQYAIGGLDRVREELIKPRAETLAVKAATLLYTSMGSAMNFVGTPGTELKTSADWGLAQACLNDQLANNSGLYVAMSNQSMNQTAGSLAAAFNPTTESATAYMKGMVKESSGLNFYATSNIPNHTNGSAAGNGTSGMIVATNVTTGATSVDVSGGTTSGTITKNTLIWFKGRKAVQPQTKKVLGTLRYFSVAADLTLSAGAGTITLTEAIYGPENTKLQNISALPVTSTDYVGVVGTESHTYEQAFFYKKNAIGFIGLKLPDLFALDASSASYEGIEVKTHAFADGTNYINMMRWDMLCATYIREQRHVGRCFTRDVT